MNDILCIVILCSEYITLTLNNNFNDSVSISACLLFLQSIWGSFFIQRSAALLLFLKAAPSAGHRGRDLWINTSLQVKLRPFQLTMDSSLNTFLCRSFSEENELPLPIFLCHFLCSLFSHSILSLP